jgi:membrane protease YdiL (CAAX protease family)
MLFRGVIQDAIQRATTSAAAAILLAGLLFGLVHAVTLSYAIFATLVGIYLGWLFIADGDLTAPIVAHGVYDFIALAYLAKIRQPRWQQRDALQTKSPEYEVDV